MPGALFAILCAAAPVEVVVARSLDTTAERADDLSSRLAAALREKSVAVGEPGPLAAAAKCQNRRPCLVKLGADLGTRWLVTLDVAHVSDKMVVNLEALEVASERRVAQRAFSLLSAGYPAGLADELSPFVDALVPQLPRDAFAPQSEPAAPAAPTVVVVAPPASPAEPARISRWLWVSTAVVALAGGGAAIGFGLSSRARITEARATEWEATRVQKLDAAQLAATAANVLFAVAGTAALVALISLFVDVLT